MAIPIACKEGFGGQPTHIQINAKPATNINVKGERGASPSLLKQMKVGMYTSIQESGVSSSHGRGHHHIFKRGWKVEISNSSLGLHVAFPKVT